MWYCSAINCKGDNSWNIWELHWESKYSKVNNILLILKCYIYRCRCRGGLQYLKYYIKIEKNSTFYMFPKQTEQINKKWLNVNGAMHGWLSLDTYIIVFVLVFYIACMKGKYHLYIYILLCVLYVLKLICM